MGGSGARFVETTRRAREAPRAEAPRAPVLVLAHHARIVRAGERIPLTERVTEVSRLSSALIAPGGDAPLSSRHLSRRRLSPRRSAPPRRAPRAPLPARPHRRGPRRLSHPPRRPDRAQHRHSARPRISPATRSPPVPPSTAATSTRWPPPSRSARAACASACASSACDIARRGAAELEQALAIVAV